MRQEKLVLPAEAPRTYGMREAYRGRVWRTPISVISREFFFWGLGLGLVGLALGNSLVTRAGLGSALILGLVSVLASLARNRKRVRIIRDGLGVKATLGRSRRIPLFHELVRGPRESTYRLAYSYVTQQGDSVTGSIWICGCARKYLSEGAVELAAHDAKKPCDSVLLRLAVMVAPHA